LLEKQATKLWQNTQLKPNLKEGEQYMILDEKIWNYFVARYQVAGKEQEIVRYGIVVNEEMEECIVEIYLR
jgi:hypothetical protein